MSYIIIIKLKKIVSLVKNRISMFNLYCITKYCHLLVPEADFIFVFSSKRKEQNKRVPDHLKHGTGMVVSSEERVAFYSAVASLIVALHES